MLFTLTFLKLFAVAIYLALPLLLLLTLLVVLLGQVAGRIEGWSRFDSLYWAFVTATTIGYGDIRPVKKTARVLAIAIAFTGIIFTGIVVSLAVQASSWAFQKAYPVEEIKTAIQRM